MRRAYNRFWEDQAGFQQHYHQRSNVESVFSMVKRKFGDSVRSKRPVQAKNEILCKLICHNICCVIKAMCEAEEMGGNLTRRKAE